MNVKNKIDNHPYYCNDSIDMVADIVCDKFFVEPKRVGTYAQTNGIRCYYR